MNNGKRLLTSFVAARLLFLSLMAVAQPEPSTEGERVYVPNVGGDFSDTLKAVLASSVAATFVQSGFQAYTYRDLADQISEEERKELIACDPRSKALHEIIQRHGFASRMFGHADRLEGGKCHIELTWMQGNVVLNKATDTCSCKDQDLSNAFTRLALTILGRVHAIVIESDPSGAAVELDGVLLDDLTPCHVQVSDGQHKVKMTLARHQPRDEVVTVTKTTKIYWTLLAEVAWLSIESEPSGLAVSVSRDGKGERRALLTPVKDIDLPPGTYLVEVSDESFMPERTSVALIASTHNEVKLVTKPRDAGPRQTWSADSCDRFASCCSAFYEMLSEVPGMLPVVISSGRESCGQVAAFRNLGADADAACGKAMDAIAKARLLHGWRSGFAWPDECQ